MNSGNNPDSVSTAQSRRSRRRRQSHQNAQPELLPYSSLQNLSVVRARSPVKPTIFQMDTPLKSSNRSKIKLVATERSDLSLSTVQELSTPRTASPSTQGHEQKESAKKLKKQVTPLNEIGQRIEVVEVLNGGQLELQERKIFSEHNRMASKVLEVDEEEDYLKLFELSFGRNNLDFDAIVKVFSEWNKSGGETAEENLRIYNRAALLSAVRTLKNDIIRKPLLLLEQLKEQPSKKNLRMSLDLLQDLELRSNALANASLLVSSFEEKLVKMSATSLKLSSLRGHSLLALQGQPKLTIESLDEEKDLPGVVYTSALEDISKRSYASSRIRTVNEEKSYFERRRQPWQVAFELIEHGLDMLYSPLKSYKLAIDPRMIGKLEAIPKSIKLACYIQIARNEKKTASSCGLFSCCYENKNKKVVTSFLKAIEGLNAECITEADVELLKASLNKIGPQYVKKIFGGQLEQLSKPKFFAGSVPVEIHGKDLRLSVVPPSTLFKYF